LFQGKRDDTDSKHSTATPTISTIANDGETIITQQPAALPTETGGIVATAPSMTSLSLLPNDGNGGMPPSQVPLAVPVVPRATPAASTGKQSTLSSFLRPKSEVAAAQAAAAAAVAAEVIVLSSSVAVPQNQPGFASPPRPEVPGVASSSQPRRATAGKGKLHPKSPRKLQQGDATTPTIIPFMNGKHSQTEKPSKPNTSSSPSTKKESKANGDEESETIFSLAAPVAVNPSAVLEFWSKLDRWYQCPTASQLSVLDHHEPPVEFMVDQPLPSSTLATTAITPKGINKRRSRGMNDGKPEATVSVSPSSLTTTSITSSSSDPLVEGEDEILAELRNSRQQWLAQLERLNHSASILRPAIDGDRQRRLAEDAASKKADDTRSKFSEYRKKLMAERRRPSITSVTKEGIFVDQGEKS
jgi:hypothetical protein